MSKPLDSRLSFNKGLNPNADLCAIAFRGNNQYLSLLDCFDMRVAKVFICRDQYVFIPMAMIDNARVFYVLFWLVLIILKVITKTNHLKPRIAKPLRPFVSAETVF